MYGNSKVYGLGPKLQRLIQKYWDRQKVVLKAGNLFGRPFNMERGVTQGNPVSPTTFNIVVDAVVRVDLLEVCGPQETEHWFGWAEVEHNICSYADGGRIAGRNKIWVHTALTDMVRIFEYRQI